MVNHDTHWQRTKALVPLALSHASVRATVNLVDALNTMMLAAKTTAELDFVTPYARATIVALFTRAAGTVLEPLDVVINEAVGKIQRQEQQEQQQHVIQHVMSNAYVVALTACLLAQGAYYLVAPGIRGVDQLMLFLDQDSENATSLEVRLAQIAAYGQWVRWGVCFEILSLPCLSLLIAHQRRGRVFLIGLMTAVAQLLGMGLVILQANEAMLVNLSNYGKVFLGSMALSSFLLTGAVKADPHLSPYLRFSWRHIAWAPLRKLFSLGLPILLQMFAASLALYVFALCVIDRLGPNALIIHNAPRKIMYPLADTLPVLAKITGNFMAKLPQQRVDFAKTCFAIIFIIFVLTAVVFRFAHQAIARLMIATVMILLLSCQFLCGRLQVLVVTRIR